MNNKQENDDDDLYTIVEPVISYCSSSFNFGVSTIFSSRQKRPNKILDISFTPSCSDNSFSFCNTIMLPYITTEESIGNNEENNYYIKEKEKNQISLVKDKTSNNTLSLNGENKENIKKGNENMINNCFLLDKDLPCNKNRSDIHIKKYNSIHSINEKLKDKDKNKENNLNENNLYENKNDINDINDINENEENEINNNKENYEYNENKNNEDPSLYLLRGRSVRMTDSIVKNTILDKSEKNLKKVKKIKAKNGLFHKLNNKRKIDKNDKNDNKRKEIALEKSKSFMEDKNVKKKRKEKMDFGLKIKTSKYCHNFLHQNKKNDKGYNDDYFKKIIKKIMNEKNKEKEKDKENLTENRSKYEKRKTKKNDDLKKDINRLKYIISHSNRIKPNKSFYIKSKFTMLKDQNKNQESDNNEKDKNIMENNLNINKKISSKEKGKKNQIKKTDTEKKDTEKPAINRKKSNDKKQTLPREIYRKIKTLKKEDNERSLKLKLKKEKNKDKDKDKDKQKDKYFNNSISKKEFSPTFKNMLISENKDKVKVKSETLLRKERSNSFYLEKYKIEDMVNQKLIDDSNFNKSEKDVKSKKKNKGIDFENALQKNKQKMQFNLFSKDKFTNTEFSDSDYLKYTLNCMDLILDINKEKQIRLKNKVNFNFPTPKKNKIKKKIALFDLDETLVHCTGDINTTKEKYQNVVEIKLPGKQDIKVGINIRPYWKQTLNLIKKNYYIVVYTASHQAYADAVLDFMDPKKKYFKYRLYRNNCSLIDVDGAKFYVKDLEILNKNYDLKDIVIIDNSVLSFAYHLHNGIPILPYYDEDKDGSLYVVGLYLMHIFSKDDLREQNKKHINLDSFLEEAKKKKEQDLSYEEYEDENNDTFESIKENEDINDNNQNSNEKKINNDKIINIRESLRKISDKKVVSFSIQKKKSISQLPHALQRKKSQIFESQKLKSKSKLLNMYYEVKKDSPKSEHSYIQKSNILEDKAKISKNLNNNENRKQNKNNNKETNIQDINSEEFDCKSDSYFINEQKIHYYDSNKTEGEDTVLKRGLTIREDLLDIKTMHSKKNRELAINHKLGFIRSNFYNTFKI